jgi:hypothetical protein
MARRCLSLTYIDNEVATVGGVAASATTVATPSPAGHMRTMLADQVRVNPRAAWITPRPDAADSATLASPTF